MNKKELGKLENEFGLRLDGNKTMIDKEISRNP